MTAHCIQAVKHSVVVFEEQRSKFKVNNKNQRDLQRHKVDGCLIVDGVKCDWLLVDVETGREIYIELKGSDVKHAVNQICASVDALSGNKAAIKLGYIICTRCPLESTEVQILKKRLLKSHNVRLKVQKTIYTEDIESMIG